MNLLDLCLSNYAAWALCWGTLLSLSLLSKCVSECPLDTAPKGYRRQRATASLPPFPDDGFPMEDPLGGVGHPHPDTHTRCTLTSPDLQAQARTPEQLHTDLHQSSDVPLLFHICTHTTETPTTRRLRFAMYTSLLQYGYTSPYPVHTH